MYYKEYSTIENIELLGENYIKQMKRDLTPLTFQTSILCKRIGMDYNANINWIVAGQPQGRRLNVIKSFYVKFERKLPALIADICEYYAMHRNKRVVFYYDTTALGGNYAVNDQDFHWVIVHEFERGNLIFV